MYIIITFLQVLIHYLYHIYLNNRVLLQFLVYFWYNGRLKKVRTVTIGSQKINFFQKILHFEPIKSDRKGLQTWFTPHMKGNYILNKNITVKSNQTFIKPMKNTKMLPLPVSVKKIRQFVKKKYFGKTVGAIGLKS